VLSLLKTLLAPTPQRLDATDARLALSALMVRIARADNAYEAAEAKAISRILMARYSLDKAAADDLRQQAEALEAEAPDTVRFTRAIKDAVDYEQRSAVVSALWQVVLADGRRDDSENSLMRLVVNLLGISDVDSALARQKVEVAQQ